MEVGGAPPERDMAFVTALICCSEVHVLEKDGVVFCRGPGGFFGSGGILVPSPTAAAGDAVSATQRRGEGGHAMVPGLRRVYSIDYRRRGF